MCSFKQLARNSVEAQERLFRWAEKRHGLSIKVLCIETGIPKSTLEGWKNGTTMPAWALGELSRAGVPDYVLSLVLNPYSRRVATDADADEARCYHSAAEAGSGFAGDYLKAVAPDSPGGPRITPQEAANLSERAAETIGKLRAVAA